MAVRFNLATIVGTASAGNTLAKIETRIHRVPEFIPCTICIDSNGTGIVLLLLMSVLSLFLDYDSVTAAGDGQVGDIASRQAIIPIWPVSRVSLQPW